MVSLYLNVESATQWRLWPDEGAGLTHQKKTRKFLARKILK
jgi:hypothetical protein